MTSLILDAFLFDLDGTLIDSTPATERAWIVWGREMGLPGFRLDRHGIPARDIVRSHVPAEQYAAGVELIMKLELEETEGIVAKPGALELLAAIPDGRWSIVTSCTPDLARVRMEVAGIPAPSILITADDVRKGKPDPEGYRNAARDLGFGSDRCLVLEDAPAGLLAGRDAGSPTLGIAGSHRPEQLHDADYVIDSLEQLGIESGEAEPSLTLRIR